MPLSLQAKLLRALQERSIERLGSNVSVAVDVRVIAAVKQDLKQLAADGLFRSDLYFRLNVASIELPPLRRRTDDIPELFSHFLRAAAVRFEKPEPVWTQEDMMRWQLYDWPGNVRELKTRRSGFASVSKTACRARRPDSIRSRRVWSAPSARISRKRFATRAGRWPRRPSCSGCRVKRYTTRSRGMASI